MEDALSIDQLLQASLPEGCVEPRPANWAAESLLPLHDFEANGCKHCDYQEDLVLSVNGLSR